MTHEILQIFQSYATNKKLGLKAVMASVVHLEGSSYRKPGVRMLLFDNNVMVGAVSGGCVEKEIKRQAQSVFKTNTPKLMTYDGRYRLGCEGVLYILIEPFNPNQQLTKAFESCVENRWEFEIYSQYSLSEKENELFGSFIRIKGESFPLSEQLTENTDLDIFTQQLKPRLKLLIIGAEHDAVQLTKYASLSGWEIDVVAAPTEEKKLNDFPGASAIFYIPPEDIAKLVKDSETAIVLMTHSYVKDLQFLLHLANCKVPYIGLLGPAARRDRLLNELIELKDDIFIDFMDSIYGPAGLDIGAITPQEIAVSIVAEILAITRVRTPDFLKNKTGTIHSL